MGRSRVDAAKRRLLCNTGITLINQSSICCETNSPSSLSSSSSSSSINNLTDDLLLHILLRFPPKFLYRCKSVCKRWHSLISSPYFARSCIRLSSKTPPINNNLMLLFKIHRGLHGIGQVYVLPLDRPQLSSSLPLTFDFIPSLCPNNNYYDSLTCFKAVERVLLDVNLKAAHCGVVLLQGVFRDKSYRNNLPYFHYYVCNPVTKQYLELPFLSNPGSIGFACYYLQAPHSRIWADVASYRNIIDQNPDFNPNKIDFTVISVNVDEQADVFVIHVFSSADETPGWSLFRAPCPPRGGWSSTTDPIQVVFYNGKFHWEGCIGIAVYDPFNNPQECDIIPFPPMGSVEIEPKFNYYSCSLEECQGRLRLVTWCEETPRLLVWELLDYATKQWVKILYVDFTVYDDIDDDRRLSYGGTVGEKIYMLHFPSTIKVFDVRNASLQHVYTYPAPLDSFLQLIKPFLSSPWPTPLPMRHRK